MRRTDAGTRGRRFAAALLAAGVVVGLVATPAAAVDSIRDQQWHLDAMKAPEIWQTSKGAGVTVAVIDSGFKLDHPDLAGQFLPGKDFSGLPGGVGDDKEGHGTGIAGIIAGTGKGLGGKGAFGLAPAVKILPLKIQNAGNSGSRVTSAEFLKEIDQAIVYAADQGAKVINISQAGSASSFSAADINDLKAAVAHASSKGSLVIAGAGNSAKDGNPVMYPAALPTVVAAAATDRNGVVTDESERGSQIDLAAPGMDIYRPCTGPSGYCKSHGTSDATAIVSASAALLWSVHPDWSPNQILRVLINTAGKPQDGSARTDLIGYGTVRPRIALTTPGDPGPANVSPLIGQMEGEATPAPSATAPASGQATAAPGSPAASAPGEGSEPVDLPVTGQAADSGSGSLPLVIGGSAAALAVIAVVVVLLMRRRRSASAPSASVPTSPLAPVGAPYGGQLPPQGGPGAPVVPYGQAAPPQYSPPAGPPQYGTPPPPPPQYGPPADPPAHNPYAQ
ncbi:type VII secretion-associated serine protease mycosin [Kitasatospora sp. NPDC057015]|uniref:type VII secretion-associated serine protease mycosin n=1 Tax=Kitasatospora sp. NPDC057015 TaxID=3346001 RepID=UPI00362AE695